MAKSSSVFICQQCDHSHHKWGGQCSGCGAWNSLVEEIVSKSRGGLSSGLGSSLGRRKDSSRFSSSNNVKIHNRDKTVVSFSQVKGVKEAKRRFSTSIGELDRVLGGGLVAGSVILIGGEPGIGKSTLLTQMVIGMLLNNKNPKQKDSFGKILYVSGEESPHQISLRISRILKNEHFISSLSDGGVSGEPEDSDSLLDDNLIFVTTTDVDEIITIISQEKPSLIIIDSIQTLSTSDLTGASGSVGQLRECTNRIVDVVKDSNIPTFLVGHVTKDGNIAGPKVLEHIVDAVLEISGERTGQLRLIRTLKNRFGATDEVGVFTMVEYGLQEVSNPSELFLEHQKDGAPGSTTVCIMEGTRPLLLEVQALVVRSQLAMPRRVGRGIELSRIQVLSAVLQKHSKLPLGETDIFLSAAGGFKIKEPAVDLGLAVAIVSSLKNKKVPQNTVFIGEIGLLGEIRSVPYLERRIKEAKRLGFKKIISKKTNNRVHELLKEVGL